MAGGERPVYLTLFRTFVLLDSAPNFGRLFIFAECQLGTSGRRTDDVEWDLAVID
jgi:hypothetical protein